MSIFMSTTVTKFPFWMELWNLFAYENPKLKANGLCFTQVDKKDGHVWWMLAQ